MGRDLPGRLRVDRGAARRDRILAAGLFMAGLGVLGAALGLALYHWHEHRELWLGCLLFAALGALLWIAAWDKWRSWQVASACARDPQVVTLRLLEIVTHEDAEGGAVTDEYVTELEGEQRSFMYGSGDTPPMTLGAGAWLVGIRARDEPSLLTALGEDFSPFATSPVQREKIVLYAEQLIGVAG